MITIESYYLTVKLVKTEIELHRDGIEKSMILKSLQEHVNLFKYDADEFLPIWIDKNEMTDCIKIKPSVFKKASV